MLESRTVVEGLSWLVNGTGQNVTGTLPTNPHIYNVTHYVLAGCYFVVSGNVKREAQFAWF